MFLGATPDGVAATTRMSLLAPLIDLLPLDRLPRTGWVLRGVPEAESIAGHLLGTAYVALTLAPRVEPPLALDRVLAMALVHDAPEARSGDLPRPATDLLPPAAKREMEEAITRELLEPMGPVASSAWREYCDGESREARFAHLCDALQLGVRLVGYERGGVTGLEEFRAGLEALECSEFPPAESLREEILATLA